MKEFFRKLAGWYPLTSLRINFFTDNFQGFLKNEPIPMAASRSCSKVLRSTWEIIFLLCMLAIIPQLVHEISRHMEVSIKRCSVKRLS